MFYFCFLILCHLPQVRAHPPVESQGAPSSTTNTGEDNGSRSCTSLSIPGNVTSAIVLLVYTHTHTHTQTYFRHAQINFFVYLFILVQSYLDKKFNLRLPIRICHASSSIPNTGMYHTTTCYLQTPLIVPNVKVHLCNKVVLKSADVLVGMQTEVRFVS